MRHWPSLMIGPEGFSPAALDVIERTGIDPAEDLARLRTGNVTPAELLCELLQGADGDDAEGFHDYVRALEAFAAS